MYIHDLKNAEGARTSQKRLGRGIGSGIGKTSGKGHKGQNARSGGGVRPGFEGGQMPLYRRLPMKGFSNAKFKKVYSTVNVSSLNIFEANTEVDAVKLLESGILSKIEKDGVKILGNGELTVALKVKANKFTAQAKEKITAQPGDEQFPLVISLMGVRAVYYEGSLGYKYMFGDENFSKKPWEELVESSSSSSNSIGE